ncbi:hypothetical protein OIY81_36 [Cryptosporidium canis]|nr:hypothetical protein OIY81_36 [Cryptosporidium canis]
MFPKGQQEMRSLDENLHELDTTVKRLENEILLKKNQVKEASNFMDEQIIRSPTKETRIVNKEELDLGKDAASILSPEPRTGSNRDECVISQTPEAAAFVSEEYVPIKNTVIKASPKISPKRSSNLVAAEHIFEPKTSFSTPGSPIAVSVANENERIPFGAPTPVPAQFHPPTQIQWGPPNHPPQFYPNHPPMAHPMQIPPHDNNGAHLRPIFINNHPHPEHPHQIPHAPIFQPGQPPVGFNARMQTLPAAIQSQPHFVCNPHQGAPIPPMPHHPVMPMPAPMQLPHHMQLPAPMPMPVPMPMPIPMQPQIPTAGSVPIHMQIPQFNTNHVPAPNMPIPFDQHVQNPMLAPQPIVGGVPAQIQPHLPPEVPPGIAPGVQVPSGQVPLLVPGTNIPNPLGMDSQMLAKYLLTAMAEECLTKKKSSEAEGVSGPTKDPNGTSSSMPSTLLPSPNIRPLIQPPKVEIDFSSPTCFSQDVFKKKCKRKAKMNNAPMVSGQYPSPDPNPVEKGTNGLHPELEINPEQHSQISPPSSPTCLSFKASVPVSILGDNPFSESITKIVTNKVSQCHPQPYMANGNFNIKSGFNVPIHPQIHHY